MIYQNHIETLVELLVIKYPTGLRVNIIIVASFLQEQTNKKGIENCTNVPGIIYNFKNKNFITFEDNFKSKGNIPMVIYFDFETTAPTDNCFDPEQKKNVCHVLCFDCCLSSTLKT